MPEEQRHDPLAETAYGDRLSRLWTPHRIAYVRGEDRPAGGYDRPGGCPFCGASGSSPGRDLVVASGEYVFAVLNRFPYNPGHLMVCPHRHVADFVDLTPAETAELAAVTQTAIRVIREVSGPAGYNVGMNLGAAGGAGIAGHLHQHVVPRWVGDTNFMPVIGGTKVLPQVLADTRDLLVSAWPAG